ncbi:hypothetical protein BJ508DRAFT_316083, partial [Ascobolus immersus RN42]
MPRNRDSIDLMDPSLVRRDARRVRFQGDLAGFVVPDPVGPVREQEQESILDFYAGVAAAELRQETAAIVSNFAVPRVPAPAVEPSTQTLSAPESILAPATPSDDPPPAYTAIETPDSVRAAIRAALANAAPVLGEAIADNDPVPVPVQIGASSLHPIIIASPEASPAPS